MILLDPLDASIRAVGARAGFDLTTRQVTQLERYLRLLEQWNRTINLTALPLEGMPAASLRRLVEEPLLAARLFPEGPVTWFDLGSGAGSPAIPIKVVRPAARLTMVESRSRKVAFLREAIRTTQLEGASVLARRIEHLSSGTDSSVDIFTLRAVRIDPDIARAIVLTASPGALILLFGPADWTSLQTHFTTNRSDRDLTVLQRVDVPRGTPT